MIARMIKGYSGSDYGTYRQLKFTDVYDSADSFLLDYKELGIQPTLKSDDSVTTLFYLLFARYGNSRIASNDLTRFKFNLFSIVFQYGPTWEKRLEIQKDLRDLTTQELMTGSKQIYNSALNPSTEPGTDTTEELTYINGQNVTHNKKGKLEAYSLLLSLLETDVTSEFLERFKSLFLKVIEPDTDDMGPSYSVHY